MSKAVKKIGKAVGKVFKSSVIGKMITGPADAQKAQAKQMARQAEAQAKTQAANTAEQARASAMAVQTDTDRQRILAEQATNQPVDTAGPSVDIAPVSTDAQARRKKFQTPQIGGAGGGGASIRL